MTELYLARVVRDDAGDPVARALFPPDRSQPLGDAPPPVGAIVLIRDGTPELLAEPDTARAQLYGILARHGVDPVHPPAVRAELSALLADPGLNEPDLSDREAQPYVTIDNEDSRDLDQAVFVERLPEGYRVHYALADAAYYVRPGSALLEESLRRGTSYYLPGLCAPMLPPELSEGLVSLNPGVPRRALVFELDLDASGRSTRTRLVRARIRSRAKLSYDGVQAQFDAPAPGPLAGAEFLPSLELLHEVGELRIALAEERGVVPFNRRTLEVGLSPDGRELEVGARERNAVERWNEQISLLCNTEGAELLEAGNPLEHVQPVFRVHPPPLDGRVDQLVETIDAMMGLHALDRETWTWRRGDERLADYLQRLPRAGEDQRVQATIQRQVRYLNRASEFSAEHGPHHALAVDGYARFSSPMREVVGIFTHKEGLETLGLKPPHDSAEDRRLRERAIAAGNAAKALQRRLEKDANKLALDTLFSEDTELPLAERPERAGTIIGLRSSRLYVLLDQLPIELKIYRSDLETDDISSYRLDPLGGTMRPAKGSGPVFRLGGGIRVRTRAYDAERARWSFQARPG